MLRASGAATTALEAVVTLDAVPWPTHDSSQFLVTIAPCYSASGDRSTQTSATTSERSPNGCSSSSRMTQRIRRSSCPWDARGTASGHLVDALLTVSLR